MATATRTTDVRPDGQWNTYPEVFTRSPEQGDRPTPRRDTFREARRSVRRWKVRNFFKQRWKELPLELGLAVARVAAKVIPGFNVPAHGRLYALVFRGGPKLPNTYEFVSAGHGDITFQVYDRPWRGDTEAVPLRLVRISEAAAVGFGLGHTEDLGHVGVHLVVTAGKNYIASTFDNTAEPENLKFHGYGTGTGAAAAGDTGLGTELTTEYVTNSTRPTGSQAHSTNTYTTIGTLSPDSGGTLAITEWGLFSANASTTLLDRQVFSAVNLVATSDSLQTTYVFTQS